MWILSLLVEDAGEFFDVLDGVFESLDLGERLSSPAVHRRQVIPQLMQRLRQTAHAQLLPLARLHPPLHAHLHFGLLLLGDAAVFASWRRVRRASIGARAHLRRRAHGFKGGLGRGRAALQRVSRRPVLSTPLPTGQNLCRSDADVHPTIDLRHILCGSVWRKCPSLEDDCFYTPDLYERKVQRDANGKARRMSARLAPGCE